MPILVYQIYHIWEKYLPISILVQISYLLIIYIYREREREIGMIYLMLGCEEVSHFGGDVILTHA